MFLKEVVNMNKEVEEMDNIFPMADGFDDVFDFPGDDTVDFDDAAFQTNDVALIDTSTIDVGSSDIDVYISNVSKVSNPSEEPIYNIEGYGDIASLSDYLNNSSGVIELLEHAVNQKQFNYILEFSEKESHDETLLQYLKDKNFQLDDFLSLDMKTNTIYQFKPLVEYFLQNATLVEEKRILMKLSYVDKHIAKIIAQRDDRSEIIAFNRHFQDIKVTREIIRYFEEHPEKKDFTKMVSWEFDTPLIRKIMELGYVVDENSPVSICNNNEIMREVFYKSINGMNPKFFQNLDRELFKIQGSYAELLHCKKDIFHDDVPLMLGQDAFEQMIKYILLGAHKVDLSEVVRPKNLLLVKKIYDNLNEKEGFNLELFLKITYKFNQNTALFDSLDDNSIEENIENLRLYFEYEELAVRNKEELTNIRQIYYQQKQQRIDSATSSIELKNIICNILLNQNYFETRQGLLESASRERLIPLKNSLHNQKLAKELDSYFIISDLLSTIDKVDDVEKLKQLAGLFNDQILKYGVNRKWLNFNDKIMSFYNYEFNERMTDFNDYVTDRFYDATDYTFEDGTNVNGRRVHVAHIPSGEKFNAYLHVLNSYSTGSAIESVITPKLIGAAYICLTGISDEYNRVCVNEQSIYSIKVLYSHLPDGSLVCAANRDTGIGSGYNNKNIATRLPKDMMPFRKIVRTTQVHGSETYNEFDAYRDGLMPSGIAFLGDNPTEEEINAAAFLGVPLVQIDDLQETYQKDAGKGRYGISLADDESFYHIKDHSYEDRAVVVTPNDKYDMLVLTVQKEIGDVKNHVESVDITTVHQKYGYDDYIANYQGEVYSALPVYDYVDSTRRNIDSKVFEEALVKEKLYHIAGVPARTLFTYGKYLGGKETLTVLQNQSPENEFDKAINFLVDTIATDDFNMNYEVLGRDNGALSKIVTMENDEYLVLFEPYIKLIKSKEPRDTIHDLLERKDVLQSSIMFREYSSSINNEKQGSHKNIAI